MANVHEASMNHECFTSHVVCWTVCFEIATMKRFDTKFTHFNFSSQMRVDKSSLIIFGLAFPALVTTRRIESRLTRIIISSLHNCTATKHDLLILFLHQMQCLVLGVLNEFQGVWYSRQAHSHAMHQSIGPPLHLHLTML